MLFSVMHPGQGRDDRPDPALRAAFMERCTQDGVLLVHYPNGEIRAVHPLRHRAPSTSSARSRSCVTALADVGAAPTVSAAR